jgi:hypothetical protein
MKSESVSGDTPHERENPHEDARPSRFRSVEMLPRMASVTSLEKHIPYFTHYYSKEFAYVQFQNPATRGLGPVPVDEIRHPFASQQFRRSGDFEMQIRLAGIAGSADARQHLAAPRPVSCLHAQTSRLQMQVEANWPPPRSRVIGKEQLSRS